MITPEVVQQIQFMVAPAVMVSSSALLMLGFNNKFSNLANRFRLLNHEKRTLQHKANKDQIELARLGNLALQVQHLMKRATYVKNAILCTYFAIICFVSTSIFIFSGNFGPFSGSVVATAVFFVGFLMLIVTSLYMIAETSLFYHVITIEEKV